MPGPEKLMTSVKQGSIEMGITNLSETINDSMVPPQSSSSGQDEQLENTVPTASAEDGVGDSTSHQQGQAYTSEQQVEMPLQQVSDFILEKSKSSENEEYQSQLPLMDNTMGQQIMTQKEDKLSPETVELHLLVCGQKLKIIQADEEQKNLTANESEIPENLQPQFDTLSKHNLSTLSQDLFLSDSTQESQAKQAVDSESDIIISDVRSLGKSEETPVNQIETEEEIWNDDLIEELQELEELGYSAFVPTQPKTQESEASEEVNQTSSPTAHLSQDNKMLSSQESCDHVRLNVKICSIPLESLKPLFHESDDLMLSGQSITENSPNLFTSDSSKESQFENEDSASQIINNENNITITNIYSLSTNDLNTTKNVSQDSFGETIDDDFANQLQELEEFGYEVVVPIQSEINNESQDQDEIQPSAFSHDDASSKNQALYESEQHIAQDKPSKDASSQDSCATIISDSKTASGETQHSLSSSKEGSHSKISDIIDEFLDSYADEIDVDDLDQEDDDCEPYLKPLQFAHNSPNLREKVAKSPLHSSEKCDEDQICFSNGKCDNTADLLIGKQPFCSEIKIAIPNEAIATEACLPNACSTISSHSTDTATLPEQSSSASMPTESLTASNTTLSIDDKKDSSKETRSMFIQTDATPVHNTTTQTVNVGHKDVTTQTILTMQHLNNLPLKPKMSSQFHGEENKSQNKIRTRSTTSKESTENTDPETNSSQGSNQGLSTNKLAKCTQDQNLLDFKEYPRIKKTLPPFVGERKIFKERTPTSVGRQASELPICKEQKVSPQIHNSDYNSSGSSGKSSPISSPMISEKQSSPNSSDSVSRPEQRVRKGKQEKIMQASYSAGSSSPPEAKKKKLSPQDDVQCSTMLHSEPEQEPARKSLRLGLSRCAKLKSLLKKQ